MCRDKGPAPRFRFIADGSGSTHGTLINMFSGNEWIIVVIAAVVLFGGSQIPKLARNLGQAQKEFKKGIGGNDDDNEKNTDSAA